MKLYALYRELVELGLGEADALHITDVVTCPAPTTARSPSPRAWGSRHVSASTSRMRSTRQEADDMIAAARPFRNQDLRAAPTPAGSTRSATSGMTGLMVTGKDGVERPHYSLRLGGACGEAARVGGRMQGRIPEEETPAVIAAIARYYFGRARRGRIFQDFVARVGADAVGKIGLAVAPGAV